jgi:hypothetical protein
MHYQRFQKYGDPNFTKVKKVSKWEAKSCSIAGCANKYFCRGYCGVHWVHATGKTESRNLWERKHRRLAGNADTRKYEKTPKGFLMRLYRNMQSRVTGVQKAKFHLYEGKSLLPRQDFYDWALDNSDFWELFGAWQRSDYDRKLTPSVNRINSDEGYELGNMEWVTHSENSRLGAISEARKTYRP